MKKNLRHGIKWMTLLLLLAAMTMLVLAGCSKKEDTTEGGSAPENKTESQETVSAEENQTPDAPIPSDNCEVTVVDEKGDPVEGVGIQFCTDELCSLVKTDTDGRAVFEGDADKYSVHVLKVPEGYVYTGEEFDINRGEKITVSLEPASTNAEASASESGSDSGSESSASADIRKLNVKLEFSTVDVDGNVVDDSIFAENKLTMVNVWEPWCGPCRGEMPDLDKLYNEMKDQGLMVLGVYSDETDLQAVLDQTGVTYPIIKSTESLEVLINATGAYPTTAFVDSEGYVLATADSEWKAMAQPYISYYKDCIVRYKGGEFAEFENNPDYAAFFDFLSRASEDESLIEEQAMTEAKIENPDGLFVGAHSYSNWKALVETRMNTIAP